MPRYDKVNIRDHRLLENTVPVRNRRRAADPKKLSHYENLSTDVKLNWSGDVVFNEKTQDLNLTFTVEAYAQSLYHRLVTQKGQHPDNGDFGWDFDYLYNLNLVEQKRMLPRVIRDVRDAVQADPDTLSVRDVRAYIERNDWQSHNIIIIVTAQPRSINDVVEITFELDGEDVN